MKNKLFALVMVIAAGLQVACDNNQSSQDKANACLSDATCVQQVRAASGGVLFPLGTTAAGATSQVPTYGYQNGVLVRTSTSTAPTTTPQVFKASTALNEAIKTQSVKVAAAIAADDSNPNSTYYKAPTPTNLPTTSGSAAPNAQASSRGPASSDFGGGSIEGEASR